MNMIWYEQCYYCYGKCPGFARNSTTAIHTCFDSSSSSSSSPTSPTSSSALRGTWWTTCILWGNTPRDVEIKHATPGYLHHCFHHLHHHQHHHPKPETLNFRVVSNWKLCHTLQSVNLIKFDINMSQICTSNHIGWWYQHRGTCTYHWRSGAALVRPQWRRPGWRQITEFWSQGVMILKSRFRLLDVHYYIDPWRSTRQVRSCKSHTSLMSCELLVTFARYDWKSSTAQPGIHTKHAIQLCHSARKVILWPLRRLFASFR